MAGAGGGTVFVPADSFAACKPPPPPPVTTPPPVKPPVAPPPVVTPPPPVTPPPVTPPVTPPPVKPPVAPPPAVTPPAAPPATSSPPTPPPPTGIEQQDRARRLIERPPVAPPLTPNTPVTPPEDDGKTTDDLIRRLGRPPEVPPTKSPPELPPTKTPPDDPPTKTPGEDPPTKTPGDEPWNGKRPGERPKVVCCGMQGDRIHYPVTTDPMEVPKDPEAPRDVATGAYQVLLHNGAFFQNERDFKVEALGIDIDWTRHWKGQVAFNDGGLLGHGWDFAFNKRIVPVAPTRLPSGLYEERVGVDTPELVYFNGQVRADRERAVHSEVRRVYNFDARFVAYVTTYKAPAGAFHEIERYVLVGGSAHPFAGHPDVKETDEIFYVLREKNGTRYVFNCRGQVIYILSRNDSPGKHIRVELRYGGPLNPLTQNPMLSEILDASGHKFAVTTWPIREGIVDTNVDCKPVRGKYAIPRIKSISGAGFWVEYNYKGKDSEPILESTVLHGDADQKREYAYDAGHRLTSTKLPEECAKGDAGKPYFVNFYEGERVAAQHLGGHRSTLFYGGKSVIVNEPLGSSKRFVVARASGYPVVESMTIKDPKRGTWTTKYEHNAFTQVTRITKPRGNGVSFTYATANAPVRLGPYRDWVEADLTYESDLAQGNLLTTTLFAGNRRFGRQGSDDDPHLRAPVQPDRQHQGRRRQRDDDDLRIHATGEPRKSEDRAAPAGAPAGRHQAGGAPGHPRVRGSRPAHRVRRRRRPRHALQVRRPRLPGARDVPRRSLAGFRQQRARRDHGRHGRRRARSLHPQQPRSRRREAARRRRLEGRDFVQIRPQRQRDRDDAERGGCLRPGGGPIRRVRDRLGQARRAFRIRPAQPEGQGDPSRRRQGARADVQVLAPGQPGEGAGATAQRV
jgi:hypothetical protein